MKKRQSAEEVAMLFLPEPALEWVSVNALAAVIRHERKDGDRAKRRLAKAEKLIIKAVTCEDGLDGLEAEKFFGGRLPTSKGKVV